MMADGSDSATLKQVNLLGKLRRGLQESGARGLARRIVGAIGRVSADRYNAMEAHLFDTIHGTDTVGIIPMDKLDVSDEIALHGTGYQCTNAWAFRTVLRAMSFPVDVGFVDIGSGKGKLLMLAAEYGFSRVVGLEISRDLCTVAETNLKRYRKRIKPEVEVEIIQADALAYPFKKDESVFCMFNPFDEVFLAQILQNIHASLKAHPRAGWFLYVNPQHRMLIDEHPAFTLAKEFRFVGKTRTIVVYFAPPVKA